MKVIINDYYYIIIDLKLLPLQIFLIPKGVKKKAVNDDTETHGRLMRSLVEMVGKERQ